MTHEFSLKLFRADVTSRTAKKEDRPQAVASWLAESLAAAARATLLGGSHGALTQALEVIESSGKTASAVHLRKALKAIAFQGFGPWVKYSAFRADVPPTVVGGNSKKCQDVSARAEACELYAAEVQRAALAVFTPKATATDRKDPLADFGQYSDKTLATRLGLATEDEVKGAVARLESLRDLLLGGLASKAAAAAAPATPVKTPKVRQAA